ncbi:LacI family DNA-binding transcriptional regulator [candidate division KSB1 bacterium]|nr:LacI family DNA-binding transcriptional regulator [candidate division KSB1 bacterium]
MNKKQKITLKTLAQMLNMTTATISKALRDGSDISVETKQKVKKLATELGYRPNIMARSLVNKRTYMLGVIVPDLRISFFSEATRGIYEQAREKGYFPIILVHDENTQNEKEYLEFLASLHVDGIILDAVEETFNINLLKGIYNQGIPFVCYDRLIKGLEFSCVTIDDENAAFQVIKYFIQDGRRNILYFGPTDVPYVARERYKGYRKALDFFNIEFRPELVTTCNLDAVDAENKMRQFLKSGIEIDAVMGVGGLVAYGAGVAILKERYSIPDQIALAEFGNNDIISRLGVPIISVYQSPYEMGKKSVDLIVDLIEDEDTANEVKHIIIDFKLMYRGIGTDSDRDIEIEISD